MASGNSPSQLPEQYPSSLSHPFPPDIAPEDLRAKLIEQYQPGSPTEWLLLAQMSHAAVCLQQVQIREITLLSEHIEKVADFVRTLNALSRYRAGLERSFVAARDALLLARTQRFLVAKLRRQLPQEELPNALHLDTLKRHCSQPRPRRQAASPSAAPSFHPVPLRPSDPQRPAAEPRHERAAHAEGRHGP